MAESYKPRVLAIGGPTASGKTALSIALAKEFNGEIICADSMQIYQGLNVGTAKITQEEMQGIPHHMVGFLSPEQSFSVADFVSMADRQIQEISSRNKLPILVGGTGLYIESLLNGVQFSQQKSDSQLRQQLELKAKQLGADEMHRELERIDSKYAATVHPNNVGRVLRALELYYSTGTTMTQQRAQSLPSEKPYNSILFCLGFEDRAVLYERIDQRVDLMMKQGILCEAELVYRNQQSYRTAAQAIGYKEFFSYFSGESELEPCVDRLKQASRNYAKRQLTWFKRMQQAVWLNCGKEDIVEKAKEIVRCEWSV